MLLTDLLASYRVARRARHEAEADANAANAELYRNNEAIIAERLRPLLAPGFPYDAGPGEVLIRTRGVFADRVDVLPVAGAAAPRPAMAAAADAPAPGPAPLPIGPAPAQARSALPAAIVLIALAVLGVVGFECYRNWPVPAPLAPVGIVVPKDARPGTIVELALTGGAVDDAEWEITGPDGAVPNREIDPAGIRTLFAGRAGDYRASVWYQARGKLGRASAAFPLADAVPPPTPPAPPAPSPPTPPPSPAPFPSDGLRVLIVYASADLSKYDRGRYTLMNSQDFRDALSSLCVKVNGHAEWRIYDKDADVSNESQVWKDAMKAVAAQYKAAPLIAVANGKAGTVSVLPATAADALEVVKKYTEVKP